MALRTALPVVHSLYKVGVPSTSARDICSWQYMPKVAASIQKGFDVLSVLQLYVVNGQPLVAPGLHESAGGLYFSDDRNPLFTANGVAVDVDGGMWLPVVQVGGRGRVGGGARGGKGG